MRLYLSKIKDKMNGKVLGTESMHPFICLNPKYSSVTISNPETKILMDSGAFQDTENHKRISFEEALDRQLKLERKVGVSIERIVAYDWLGNVEETIKANKFLSSKREYLKPRQLVFMLQGNTVDEVIYCLKETLSVAKPGDCIGFGGVAIAGRNKTVRERFLKSFWAALPLLKEANIKDIHLFGVGTFSILKQLSTTDFNVSCDTSSFELRSVMGNVVDTDNEKWVKVYSKEDKLVNYHPCDLTLDNMKKAIMLIGGY